MKSVDTVAAFLLFMIDHKDIFVCPACSGALNISINRYIIECPGCNISFKCEDGIPLMFYPGEFNPNTDVTETVKAFYEETPFPNYEELDSKWRLIEKSEKGTFARLLDRQIPYGAVVLEVGCGTGQLSNFLGIKGGRTVIGTDICVNSLKLGAEFRAKNTLNDVAFFQMNLFRPIFRPESFHIVICNGVLHHTGDPFLGFKSILKLVKKGGFIIIGLYNTYGRIPTAIRRFIFKISGDRFKFLDSRLRDKSLEYRKRHTWFMDQYKHPHESTHTIDEVLDWFAQSGVEYTNSIPKAKAFESFSQEEKLFKLNDKGTFFDHLLVQCGIVFKKNSEGGFFTMIGRRMF
ncbi:MAG: methyltransferase domain-containing protein [Nitrospirae bacterium]|nr:methyltransferase domain-containing protein [Nitrospirota bacterium]